jgi:phenylacetate-CoA ligase
MDKEKIKKENRYFDKKMETMSPKDLKDYQFKKTKEILEKAYNNSSFYRNLFDQAKVLPDDFKTLDDIKRFPCIDKKAMVQDQDENPPMGSRMCLPPSALRRINITSGTSGMGQEVHCHDEDAIYAANASTAAHFVSIGLDKGDISAVLYPLATMTGGLLSYEGLRIMGATPLAIAIFSTNQKIELMQRFNVSHICTTPAYLSRIASIVAEAGHSPKEIFPHLKGITLSTEPFSAPWAVKMENLWDTVLHDVYGSTQFNLNYATTCKYGVVPDGEFGFYHLNDHFVLVEVLNPETDEPVKFGEFGEPVITTFYRKAMPLIRFRTQDRIRLLPPDLCDCGRTASALWEVGTISRYDDMFKIKATNVWPQTIDTAVFSFDEIDEYNGRIFITDSGKEVGKVSVEFKKMPLANERKSEILQKLRKKIKEKTQVSMEVEDVPYGTLPRFEYKVRRWTDERITGLERVKYIEK